MSDMALSVITPVNFNTNSIHTTSTNHLTALPHSVLSVGTILKSYQLTYGDVHKPKPTAHRANSHAACPTLFPTPTNNQTQLLLPNRYRGEMTLAIEPESQHIHLLV